MSPETFQGYAAIVAREFGIQLPPAKQALLESRLYRLLREDGPAAAYGTAENFLRALRQDATGRLLSILSEAITTHHTFFLREADHFAFYRDEVLPYLERTIRDGDIRTFTEAGYVCKLVAAALPTADGVAAWIEPTLLSARTMLAAVPANFNLITFVGENAGEQSFYGQGAGRFPTAYNLVQDCIDILGGTKGFYESLGAPAQQGSTAHPYYVRTRAKSEWLDSVTDRALGDGVVTQPVSNLQMHAFMASIAEADPDAFMAGIR